MKHLYFTWILIAILFTILSPHINGKSADSVRTSWIQRYNGCDTCVTNVDEAHRIGIDQNGNVYVGGYSTIHTGGLYTDMDYCVVKYNPSGDQLWTARYDGPAHSQDLLYDMKVDKSGNVYATGASYEYPSNLYPIYTTVKWNTDGVLQWASHYTGSTRTSRAWGIAIDSAGNSYVTGESFEGGASLVLIATVKYNPNGVQQWVARYSLGNSQQGIAITADKNGNVYVIGRVYTGTYNDWVTIKYNSQGVEQWHKPYDNGRNDIPAALVLDPAQNIYVTGASESSGLGGYWNDFLTIKYDTAGNQLWLARYDAPVHGPDDSRAIIYDALTNSVVVTGGSALNTYYGTFLTIKYNADKGDTVWTTRYFTPYLMRDGANAITNDTSGNIYVTGGSVGDVTGYDYGTVKYDKNGVQQWAQSYDGATGNDFSYGIVTDNLGAVYVTGVSPVPGTGPDYLTIKYSDQILPVELTSFTAEVNKNNVMLKWKTAAEINNYGFEIERRQNSKNANNWQKIEHITGHGSTSETNFYSFTDKNVEVGSYTYRLKQIDYNGSYKYSDEIKVDISNPKVFSLEQNYPNPFNPTTSINFYLATGSNVILKIYNSMGQEVQTVLNKEMTSGYHKIEFNASKLSSGVYFYTMQAKGYNGVAFVSTKKMVVLK